MADNRPIGLFDSGVGGLSVFLEIKKKLPKETYIFLADQSHNPYGSKTKKELCNLGCRITKFLLSHDIKLMVVACNTATCYSLGYLRSKFKIPIIGVVPAIKPATNLSKNSRIAIMSTPATAKSLYLSVLISDNASKFNVLNLACEDLAQSIEGLKTEKITKLLKYYSKKIEAFGADVVVLGCTHFQFIKFALAKNLSKNIVIIDSSEAIAKRVIHVLTEKYFLSSRKSKDLFYTTANPDKFSHTASQLLQFEINSRKANI